MQQSSQANRMRISESAQGLRTTRNLVEIQGQGLQSHAKSVPQTAENGKRTLGSWHPVTETVQQIFDSQIKIRENAASRADIRKQEALNLLAISRREAERKKSLSMCREEIKRRESQAVVELLNLTDIEQPSTKSSISKRRASSATEMILAKSAASLRPVKRTGSQLNVDLLEALEVAVQKTMPKIPPFRGPKASCALAGYLNLPIKKDARSLAHACGFPSFSIFS